MAAISADINLNASDGRTDREKEFPLSIAVHGPSAHLIQVTYQQ